MTVYSGLLGITMSAHLVKLTKSGIPRNSHSVAEKTSTRTCFAETISIFQLGGILFFDTFSLESALKDLRVL